MEDISTLRVELADAEDGLVRLTLTGEDDIIALALTVVSVALGVGDQVTEQLTQRLEEDESPDEFDPAAAA